MDGLAAEFAEPRSLSALGRIRSLGMPPAGSLVSSGRSPRVGLGLLWRRPPSLTQRLVGKRPAH